MWLILQQDDPDDYVIATGEQYSVRSFIEKACAELEIELEWMGDGVEEVGIDRNTGNEIISIDPRYFRPTEVDTLLGDPTKAKQKLGWEPKITFDELVKEMVAEDYKAAKKDAFVREAGYETYNYHE